MTMNCLGGNCRTGQWMRTALLLAGAYHILFAVWTNLWPFHGFDILGIPRPNHPMLWRILGLISGFLGMSLLIASSDPIRHWLIVLLGFGKAATASAIVSFAVYHGNLPAASLYFLPLDDLIWLFPLGAILWASIRAHAGIPPSRSSPYTIAEASSVYSLSTGETLAEASRDKTLVLVFLRHFGCTFTRQILRGLQELEQQAKSRNATLVLIHMLQSGEEIDYLGHNSDIPRIADPRCELYRAFGLGKGGFLELFGPHVWWRGMIAVFKGCGVGHLAGDGLQMPGAFVFQNGSIVSSQPAHTAADLPDLGALFNPTPLA
jgi:hypothetical protein